MSTPAAPARTNGFAIASLILALLGITIPALICGYLGRRQIDKSQGTEQGRGLALAGIIIGWLQVAAGIALVCVLVVVARNATDDTTTANNNPPAAETADQTEVTGTPLAPLGLGGEQDPAVGALAPVVAGHGFDGAPVDIGGQSDTASLVVFMPHWCPHCQIELPQLVQWAADGTIPHDVRLVAVATSTDPAQNNYPPQDWFDRENWPGEILADSDDNKAATAYGVSSFPFLRRDQHRRHLGRTSRRRARPTTRRPDRLPHQHSVDSQPNTPTTRRPSCSRRTGGSCWHVLLTSRDVRTATVKATLTESRSTRLPWKRWCRERVAEDEERPLDIDPSFGTSCDPIIRFLQCNGRFQSD